MKPFTLALFFALSCVLHAPLINAEALEIEGYEQIDQGQFIMEARLIESEYRRNSEGVFEGIKDTHEIRVATVLEDGTIEWGEPERETNRVGDDETSRLQLTVAMDGTLVAYALESGYIDDEQPESGTADIGMSYGLTFSRGDLAAYLRGDRVELEVAEKDQERVVVETERAFDAVFQGQFRSMFRQVLAEGGLGEDLPDQAVVVASQTRIDRKRIDLGTTVIEGDRLTITSQRPMRVTVEYKVYLQAFE